MMAATWLVRSDPTPTPRIPKRAKTRIIPGATAGIWRTMSENDPPRAARASPPPITVHDQQEHGQARTDEGRGEQLGGRRTAAVGG